MMSTSQSAHCTVPDLTNFFEEKVVKKNLTAVPSENNLERQSELEGLKAEIDIKSRIMTAEQSHAERQGEKPKKGKHYRTVEDADAGNFRQKLIQWKERVDYATGTYTADTNTTNKSLVRQSMTEETNDEILLTDTSADGIKEYEVKRKLSTFNAEIRIKANAIKEQEQLNYKVVEVRTSLFNKLCSNGLIQSECTDIDGIARLLQKFNIILPAEHMHHNQAMKAIEQIIDQNSSRMLAITREADSATSTELLSDDFRERKFQIDKQCDASIELAKTRAAEVKMLTSGTKKEIKNMRLMHKVAYSNSEGHFQPEAVVKMVEELTPTNSSSSSEETYKKMY